MEAFARTFVASKINSSPQTSPACDTLLGNRLEEAAEDGESEASTNLTQ